MQHDEHSSQEDQIDGRREKLKMATSATLHCLLGCGIGEVVGLAIGIALALSNVATIVLAVTLGFVFGFSVDRWLTGSFSGELCLGRTWHSAYSLMGTNGLKKIAM